MRKRIFSIWLCLCAAASLLPAGAMAAGSCAHAHDETCGYVESAEGSCTHVCGVQASVQEPTPEATPDAAACTVCGEAHADADCPVAAASALMDGLPTADELRAMDAEAFNAAGEEITLVYEAYGETYASLTDGQKPLLPEPDAAFAALFAVLNEGVTVYVDSGNISSLSEIGNMGGSYILTGDTTYSAATPVGCTSSLTAFTGTLDGGGHTITITGTPTVISNAGYCGLFGKASSATFKNINIVVENGFSYSKTNISENSGGTEVRMGALVSYASGCTFENCTVTVADGKSMTASLSYSNDNSLNVRVGGLVGYSSGGNSYRLCSFDGTLSGSATKTYGNGSSPNTEVGGLVGYEYGGTNSSFLNCHSAGSITGSASGGSGSAYCNVGGLVGGTNYAAPIQNCYSLAAAVSATATGGTSSVTANAGGLVGYLSGSAGMDNCCYGGAMPTVTSRKSAKAGLLAGQDSSMSGNITNCWYASGGTAFGASVSSSGAKIFTDNAALCASLNSVAKTTANADAGYYWWKQTGGGFPTLTPPVKHEHDGVTFTEWTNTTALPTTQGSYYLSDNVTLDAATWRPSGTTNLCLNGKTVTGPSNYPAVSPAASATLSIYDCVGGGEISSTGNVIGYGENSNITVNLYGGTLHAKPDSTGKTANAVIDGTSHGTDCVFNLRGGTVKATAGTTNTGPCIGTYAMTVNLYGGKVETEGQNGVITAGGQINLRGDTEISHGAGMDSIKTTAAGKIDAAGYTGKPLTVLYAGSLTAGTVVVTGVNDTTADKFTLSSSNADYCLKRDNTNLILAKNTITATVNLHRDGTAWSNSGKMLALYQNGEKKYDMTANGSTYTATNLAPGTYDVYADGVNTNITVTGDTAVTVGYYTVTYDKGTSTSTPPTVATVLNNTYYNIDNTCPLQKTGYMQVGWTRKQEAFASSGYTIGTTVTAALTLYPMWQTNAPAVSMSATYNGSNTADKAKVDYNGGNIAYSVSPSHVLEGVSYEYKWYTGPNAYQEHLINGETGSSYAVAAPAVGKYTYTCAVTAKDSNNCVSDHTDKPFTVTIAPAAHGKPDAPEPDGKTYNSITVTAVPGQRYLCQPATAAVPATDAGDWNTTGTFTGLDPNRAYKLYTYQTAADANHADSPVSDALEVTTEKVRITAVTAPFDVTLESYYATGGDAKAALSETAESISEDGENPGLTIAWTPPEHYNAAPGATNTFGWSVSAPTNYKFESGVTTSGSVTVTNKAAAAVSHTVVDAKCAKTYAGETISVTDLFTLDANAGAAAYSVTPGTGAGEITPAGVLTVTRAGTFTVTVETEAKGNYAAGTKSAQLTVNKGEGAGSVRMEGWTYGAAAETPVPASATNGVGHVTYRYEGVSPTSYDSAAPPANAGSYQVTATFAETDLYHACSGGDPFTVAQAPISFTVAENSHKYDNTAKTAAVAQAAGQGVRIDSGKFSVSYKLPTDAAAAASKTAAGGYDVIVTLSDSNFCFAGAPDPAERSAKVGALTIERDAVTLLWLETAAVYDGEAKAPAFALSGLKDGDKGRVSARLTETISAAGTHSVTAELYGDAAGNYDITNPGGTLTIQKAPVSFTVSHDSARRDGGAHTAEVTAAAGGRRFTEFTVRYQNAGGETVHEPTDEGGYDLYAQITNANYRHAGAADGAERKIGVLTIYAASAPAAYTVRFDANGGAGIMEAMPAAQAGTARVLPECGFARSGWHFAGWQYGGKVDRPGSALAQPASDLTLKALWAENAYSIGGTVNADGSPVADAVVTLTLGSEQIAQTATDARGAYSFQNVLPGIYNLAASKDGVTQTILAAITDGDAAGQTIAMPRGKLSSIVEVKAGTPAIVVGNLETAFTEEDILDSATKAVELKLSAQAVAADRENTEHREIAKTAGSSVGLYLDMTLTKSVDGIPAAMASSPVLLTAVISLPAELQGRDRYTVYRMHGGVLETLTASPNAEGEKIELSADRTVLTVYAKNFSTYAVAGTTDSGGGGGGAARYSVNIADGIENGSVTVSGKSAYPGDAVFVTAAPHGGYALQAITVTGSDGKAIRCAMGRDGRYAFVMPSRAVTVSAEFGRAGALPFTDVAETDWFYGDAAYVFARGLMNGTGDTAFGPHLATTRGMIVAILYRLEGEPAVTGDCPFGDVPAGRYAEKAVIWAAANGIVEGYGDGTFGPNDSITREQLAAILWRYAGYKGYDVSAGADLSQFTDEAAISGYARTALRWATASGLINGKGGGVLDPKGNAERCQAAAILHRFCEGFAN